MEGHVSKVVGSQDSQANSQDSQATPQDSQAHLFTLDMLEMIMRYLELRYILRLLWTCKHMLRAVSAVLRRIGCGVLLGDRTIEYNRTLVYSMLEYELYRAEGASSYLMGGLIRCRRVRLLIILSQVYRQVEVVKPTGELLVLIGRPQNHSSMLLNAAFALVDGNNSEFDYKMFMYTLEALLLHQDPDKDNVRRLVLEIAIERHNPPYVIDAIMYNSNLDVDYVYRQLLCILAILSGDFESAAAIVIRNHHDSLHLVQQLFGILFASNGKLSLKRYASVHRDYAVPIGWPPTTIAQRIEKAIDSGFKPSKEQLALFLVSIGKKPHDAAKFLFNRGSGCSIDDTVSFILSMGDVEMMAGIASLRSFNYDIGEPISLIIARELSLQEDGLPSMAFDLIERGIVSKADMLHFYPRYDSEGHIKVMSHLLREMKVNPSDIAHICFTAARAGAIKTCELFIDAFSAELVIQEMVNGAFDGKRYAPVLLFAGNTEAIAKLIDDGTGHNKTARLILEMHQKGKIISISGWK